MAKTSPVEGYGIEIVGTRPEFNTNVSPIVKGIVTRQAGK